MRKVLPSLLALMLAIAFIAIPDREEWEASPQANTVALAETFDGVQFPPTGWSLVNHNGEESLGWGVDRTDFPTPAAEHEDEYGLSANNSLQTPVLDLSDYGQVYLHFQSLTWFANYQSVHRSRAGDGVSAIEISVDGGNSFTRSFWVSEQTLSGCIEQIDIDLSPFAGQREVVLRFSYRGTFAHNWVIDSVVVDAWPVSPPPPPGPPSPWASFREENLSPAPQNFRGPLDLSSMLESAV